MGNNLNPNQTVLDFHPNMPAIHLEYKLPLKDL